jgi:hypothetical protein
LHKKTEHGGVVFSGEDWFLRWQLRSPEFSKQHQNERIIHGFVRFFTRIMNMKLVFNETS